MEQAAPETLVMDDRDAGLFRVHRSAFTDPQILETERRRVFDQCWIYAGHASEVPRRGDFQTRRVAGRPVILVRGMDGVVECVVPNIFLVPNIHEKGNRPVERDKASEVSWAVPVDDTHVMGLSIVAWPLVDGEPDPAWRPGTDTVTYDERGQKIRPGDPRNRPYEDRQRRPDDMEAQEGQRAIAIHDLENLVSSDRGTVLLRRMLERQIEAVQRGRDPLNIVRDPDKNHAIETHAFDTVRPKETADLASVW